MEIIILTGVLVALGAATSGMWSPCGLSMLTSINPVSERGRNHRYGVTAVWFIVGGVLGGATLGTGAALLAQLVRLLDPGLHLRLGLGAAFALLALLLDLGVLGVTLPIIRRQVNERWLDEFRGWFYGLGFGWQIGVGFATYVMTASTGLLVVLGALTGSPAVAMALCVLFGLARGSGVLLTARIRTPDALRRLLSRLDQIEEPVRRAVMALEVGAGALLVAGLTVWAAAVVLLAGLVLIVRQTSSRRRLSRSAP
jgi:MFS family permease